MVDSITLQWWLSLNFFFFFFFLAHADNVFIGSKLSGYAYSPVEYDIQSFLPLLIIHQGAVPSASRPSHCQAGYDSDDVI